MKIDTTNYLVQRVTMRLVPYTAEEVEGFAAAVVAVVLDDAVLVDTGLEPNSQSARQKGQVFLEFDDCNHLLTHCK
jgi:hypothetical protein